MIYRTFVSQVITGYLPSLILQLFQHYVPPTMILLSSIQGYIGYTHIEKSACYKILLFTIWNVFIANVLSGSILYQANVFLELKNIPSVLAVAVPGQVSYIRANLKCYDSKFCSISMLFVIRFN